MKLRAGVAQFLALTVLTGITAVVAAPVAAAHSARGAGRSSPPCSPCRSPTAAVPPELRLGIAHWSEGDAAWTLVLLSWTAGSSVRRVLAAHYA